LAGLLTEFPWLEVGWRKPACRTSLKEWSSRLAGLLFLDIQMPAASWLDLLSGLEHLPPGHFTTAHDEHAVRAFEVDALDYLLKPIDPARLPRHWQSQDCICRTGTAAGSGTRADLRRDGERCWFVRSVNTIAELEGNYIRPIVG